MLGGHRTALHAGAGSSGAPPQLPPPPPPPALICNRTGAAPPLQLHAELKRKAAQLDQADNQNQLLKNELAALKAAATELQQVGAAAAAAVAA